MNKINLLFEEENIMNKLLKFVTATVMATTLCACSAPGQSSTSNQSSVAEASTDNSALQLLTDYRTNWNFSSEAVKEDDLQTILSAGLNSPSALNAKPWQFNVVTDPDLINELADTDGSKTAPVMILVSVDNSNEMKILDAGLATEAMSTAAQILGYSTKIETAPARTVRNDESGKYAEMLEIGEDKSCRAALFIGYPDEKATDAESSATVETGTDGYVKYYTSQK